MQDFAEKNDGESGCSRDAIEQLVLEKRGEWSDVLRAMAPGMNLCGIEGYQLGGCRIDEAQNGEKLITSSCEDCF